jgi:hypothetical protein
MVGVHGETEDATNIGGSVNLDHSAVIDVAVRSKSRRYGSHSWSLEPSVIWVR